MKKNILAFLAFALALVPVTAFSQKIVKESGDVSPIANESVINVQYQYDGMAVGKFKTEEEYTSKKVEEYNKKEAGKGDKWLEGWKSARQTRYEPKFEELINDVLSKKKVSVKQDAKDAKYTLIVKTTFTEPGYNVGMMKYPAFCNYDFLIVETANPSKVVAKLYVQNVMGSQAMGFDFDAGSRIAESYAKAGKMLGKYFLDNAFKAKK